MGQHTSKSGGGGKGATAPKGSAYTRDTSAKASDGSEIDLKDTPLVYGEHDAALSGSKRSTIEAQERKRLNAKVEYAFALDRDGNQNPLAPEKRGGKGSVSTNSLYWRKDGVFTHNHPRTGDSAGILGGTFSVADIRAFTLSEVATMRASASEGTYSISRRPGFDNRGLMNYMRKLDQQVTQNARTKVDAAYKRLRAKEITLQEYRAESKKATNAMLVELHNGLLKGQNYYGYSYTLERRAQ